MQNFLKKAFYEKKELDPDIHQKMPENMLQVPEGVDPELLGKVLADPGDGCAAGIDGIKNEQ